MRALFLLVALLTIVAVGCAPTDDGTTCGRARTYLGQCGVMLPMLDTDTCTGTAEEISKCILTTNGSCDALATLGKNLQQCIDGDAGTLPDDFSQVFADDAGRDGESSSSDAGTIENGSDAATVIDAAPPSTDVFEVSGTISSGEQQVFQTSRLGVGNYTFTFTVSGAVDVYVRKGFAATTASFDCVVSDPSNVCIESVATSAVLYVLVVGEAPSSTFRIEASP